MADHIQSAIDTLKRFEPFEGYFLAFSGGKDSICCYHLLKLSGVKFDAHYSITTVDEPSVKPFIRKHYPVVIFDHPKLSMFQLIEKTGFLPTRKTRYCCKFLKEYSGSGRLVITGIRKEESFNRSKRFKFEVEASNRYKGKCLLNLIIDWKVSDVWNFITSYKLITPDYYAADCRSARGGCIGCPMTNPKVRIKEFNKYPKYKIAYLNSIKKSMAMGNFSQFSNHTDVFNWWLSDLSVSNYMLSKNQLQLSF